MKRTPHIFQSGERVLLKVRKGRKEVWLIAVFQAMQSRTRVIVWVDDPDKLDDDGMRLVDMKSLKPYYDHPTDQQRRARHAMRVYKMGIRTFRVGKPEGKPFYVETIDVERGMAVGRMFKRKTVQIVPLHSLWPNVQ
jgi:hypothetical protein